MRSLRTALVVALVSAASARADRAYAADPPGSVRYTIAPGDTCAAISLRHYGDARLVDLIHSANANMGPPPHALKAGDVLVLPPKPSASATQPDARLTWKRNRVEVLAPEPREGKVDDPLYRGNRVGTKSNANADVTFRDETQVKLGENTLVVIFGDVRARATRLDAAETTLVTGSLRSRLSELAGKGPMSPRVATEGASVALQNGEAQVSVDDKKTTRVAVYKGATALRAQDKAVQVNDGYGSKADLGSPPTPPAPLPLAPLWAIPGRLVVTTKPTTDLEFVFTPAGGFPAAQQWHVQLARDPSFVDIVVDERVSLDVTRIESKNAPAGVYFARASALDADRFEGKWSTVAKVTVASLAERALPGRKSHISVSPGGVTCTVGGGTGGEALEVDRSAGQLVSCVTDTGERRSMTFARIPVGAVRASAELVGVVGRRGSLRVTLTDETGAPIENVALRAMPPPGMHLGPFSSTVSPGTYGAPVTLDPTARGGPLSLEIDGDAHADTDPVTIAPAPPPRSPFRVEVAGGGRFATVAGAEHGAIGIGAGARLAFPLKIGAALVGVDGSIDRLLSGAGKTETGSALSNVSGDIWAAQLVTGLRAAGPRARLAPYVVVGPQIAYVKTSAQLGGVASEGTRTTTAIFAAAGLDLRMGHDIAAFAEVTGRQTIRGESSGTAMDVSGVGLSLGVRYATGGSSASGGLGAAR
jgi:hypothetical protein